MSLPTILKPGEGRSVKIGATTRCTFKVTGKDTQGHFGLFEYAMAPGAEGAPPHLHKRLTEMFYVVEGEMELLLKQRRVIASPGTFMLVPQGTPHGFSNPGSRRSKLLILFCPADSREGYFEDLAEVTRDGRQPTDEALVGLMRKFDQYLVPGPSPA